MFHLVHPMLLLSGPSRWIAADDMEYVGMIDLLSTLGMAALFGFLAWLFYTKYDGIQGFFLSSVPKVFRPEEYKKSRSYRFQRYFTVGFFMFLSLLGAISSVQGLILYFSS